ncbi:MAG: D-alanyl-D-alanine carboxypeptidase/D-alanyl-D-alanine-endopeptidase [Saprospiraceae bacterium]
MKKKLFTSFICLIYWSISAQTSLQSNLDMIIQQSFYKHAHIGISIRDGKTGKIIASHEKDRLLIPASTIKLLTTFSGVEILGEPFKFTTKVTYDGDIDADGNLKGNIYIEGSGDPSLGSDRIPGVMPMSTLINQIIEDVKKAGILCLEGNIIADESIFNSFPISPSWQWNDLGNYYAAGAWGININENLYNIYYHRSGAIGSTASIAYYQPTIPSLQLANEVTIDSADTEDNAYIFGGPYHYGKRIVGTIPQGKNLFKIKGSLPDPPLFMAYSIMLAFAKNEMGGHNYRCMYHPDPKASTRKRIASYDSPPLSTLIKYTNESSINMYAEAILKTIAIHKSGKGTGTDGIKAIKAYLTGLGIDTTPLHMEDGSGLSSRNLMSPDVMSEFLYYILKNKDEGLIKSTLPRVGETGTVRNILSRSKAKGKMWIKSGSMDKVLTYAGYCQGASGRLVTFSVFLNGSTAKNMKENKAELEKILEAIYRFS